MTYMLIYEGKSLVVENDRHAGFSQKEYKGESQGGRRREERA